MAENPPAPESTPPPSPRAGGGGGFLTQRWGRLPAWQWIVMGGAGAAAVVYIVKKRAAASSASSSTGASSSSGTPAASTVQADLAAGIDPASGMPFTNGPALDNTSNGLGPDVQAQLDAIQQDEENEALGGGTSTNGSTSSSGSSTPPGTAQPPIVVGGSPGAGPTPPPVKPPTTQTPPPPRQINPGTPKVPTPRPVATHINAADYPTQIPATAAQGKNMITLGTYKGGKFTGKNVGSSGAPVYALVNTVFGPIWQQGFDPKKLPNGTKIGTLKAFAGDVK